MRQCENNFHFTYELNLNIHEHSKALVNKMLVETREKVLNFINLRNFCQNISYEAGGGDFSHIHSDYIQTK